MIDLLVYLAVFVIIVVLVWWLLQQLALPEPIGKIITIVLVVIIAIILIGLLLQFAGNVPQLRLK
jgi:branched-subunit amino acid permease